MIKYPILFFVIGIILLGMCVQFIIKESAIKQVSIMKKINYLLILLLFSLSILWVILAVVIYLDIQTF